MDIKKPLLIILLSLISFSIIAQSVIITKSEIIESRNGKSYYVHTVQKGQTVYSISRAYDLTPDEIYFENPNSNQGININQQLLIPTVNKETELTTEVSNANFDFFYHVAANNETFEKISSIYLIPVKYIKKANPKLLPPFREGEYIKVPVEDAFNILDGKVKGRPVLADNPIAQYKPPVRKKPDNNRTQTDNTNKTNNNSSNKSTKQVSQKPSSQTVSFDPSIPVIQDYRHVVILGETTESIAKKYDISVEVLKAANPGLGNSVEKGDRLRVPDRSKMLQQKDSTEKEKPSIAEMNQKADSVPDTITVKQAKEEVVETTQHIVKKKETLYSIGREYGLTVDELIKANPGLSSLIKIGQVIVVPKKKITQPFIIHKTEANTRTSKIAKLYQISVFQIKDFNPEIGNRVYKGDDIKIPVGSSAFIVPVMPEDEITHQDENENEQDPSDKSLCDFVPHSNKVFKVALMIPLSLEETDSLDVEQFFLAPKPFFKSFRFIKFYEGALMALDSVTKQGANIEFFVYDVDKNITKTVKVLTQPELKSMDLIIGPFFNNSFNQVALFAGNFNIPIVNPLSYRDEVANNYKTVFKVKPTEHAQKPILETYINKFSKNSKVFLISQTSYVDADIVTEINNGILSIIDYQVEVSNKELLDLSYLVAERDTLFDPMTTPPPFLFENTEIYPEIIESKIADSTTINNHLVKINYSVDSLYPFLENASPIRNNLVILHGNKKSFLLDVLNRLNESRDTFNIDLMGVPTWERINNLSNVKMDNLNLTYFASSYVDYDADNMQKFVFDFRNRYSTEPDNYAFSGFDITYFFLNALYYLDDDFNECIDQFQMDLTQGRYQFQRVGNTNNFVNNYWHLLQINKLSKVKISDYLLQSENEDYFYE